jgi:hypothetical protein
MDEYTTTIVCLLDLVAAFAIICLMLETTRHASIHGFIRGDAQSVWALIRRVIYSFVAIALFAKSVFLAEGRIVMQPADVAIWMVIVFALIIFPALRAAGVVDQDRWVGFHRRKR